MRMMGNCRIMEFGDFDDEFATVKDFGYLVGVHCW
jgi:hypothetical protein